MFVLRRLDCLLEDSKDAVLEEVRFPREEAYERRGDAIYAELADHQKAIADHIERKELSLSPKNRKALFTLKTWVAQKALMEIGQ